MSTPPPRLRLVAHDPRRIWRVGFLIAMLWGASLSALYFYVRSTLAPQLGQVSHELEQIRHALDEARSTAAKLEVALAQHQRGEQVAERAAQELQVSLVARQDEIASLRNDLGFYQRLMEGGSQQAGITVHSFEARRTDAPRAWQFALTLSQNLKRNRLAAGKVEVSVSGSQGEKSTRLSLDQLGGDSASIAFSFKYFQQLAGLLMLPEGFTPAAVRVRVMPEGGPALEREFVWAEVSAAAPIPAAGS